MSDAIIVALLTLGGTILSVVITSKTTQNKMTQELQTQNAIQNQKIDQLGTDITTVQKELTDKMNSLQEMTDYKINQLADKQLDMGADLKEHNGYARQLPEIQGKLDLIAEKQEVANKRISDLEAFQRDTTNRLINEHKI